MRLWIATLSLAASVIAVPFCPAMAAHAAFMDGEQMAPAMAATQHVHASAPDCCIGSPIHSTEQAVSANSVALSFFTGIFSTATATPCINPLEGSTKFVTDHHPPNVKFESRSKSKRE